MVPYKFKNFILLALTSLIIFYLLVAGINLGLRLTVTRQPVCNPVFCKQIVNEGSYCLLTTPGASDCLKVSGFFFIPSFYLAYSLLGISLLLARFIDKKFYLLRVFMALIILAILVYLIRVFLGAATFSIYGFIYEFQKLGLF